MSQCCFIGKGIVYGRLAGSAAPALAFGNVSKLALNISTEEKTVKDYTTGGGGNACSLVRVSDIAAAITMNCMSAANIARAIAGTAGTVAAGAVTNSPRVAYKGGFVPVAPGYTSLVVKNQAGSTTYVLNTDYTLTTNGIIIVAAGAITDAQNITVSYTGVALDTVDILTGAFGEFQLYFDGLNEIDSGKGVLVELYKFKFGPAAALELIGDDPSELAVTGKLNADTTKTGVGVSQYMKMQFLQ